MIKLEKASDDVGLVYQSIPPVVGGIGRFRVYNGNREHVTVYDLDAMGARDDYKFDAKNLGEAKRWMEARLAEKT